MEENYEAIDQQPDDEPAKREQSTISFPYLDLDAAVEVAKAVYNRSGLGSCDLDELAAEMSQTMSGAFRLKTGTARIFDLVEKSGKSAVVLTELGRKIVVPESEADARAEAFMHVPLYSAVYEKYKGHHLPSAKALENEMQALGVASKQKDKARQAFHRSAGQAGFFHMGEERLVRPKQSGAVNEVSDSGTPKQELNKEPEMVPASAPAKPLEYQLIDLMSEPDIEEEVKASIWSLVQYLTARKKKSTDGAKPTAESVSIDP